MQTEPTESPEAEATRHYEQGASYLKLGLPEEAEREFRKVAPHHAEYWQARAKLAIIAHSQSDWKTAEQLNRELITSTPAGYSAQFRLALALHHQGRYSEAEGILDALQPN